VQGGEVNIGYVIQLTECYDVTCRNEASGSKGFRGLFCRKCKISVEQFTLPCLTCKKTFVKNMLNSALPLYCSASCKDRASYLRARNKRYDKGLVKPNSYYNSVLSILLARRCNAKMLCEHAGYTIKALPMIITRLRKDGWNIKNYHGYYELEE
jgi:hypothetical protein